MRPTLRRLRIYIARGCRRSVAVQVVWCYRCACCCCSFIELFVSKMGVKREEKKPIGGSAGCLSPNEPPTNLMNTARGGTHRTQETHPCSAAPARAIAASQESCMRCNPSNATWSTCCKDTVWPMRTASLHVGSTTGILCACLCIKPPISCNTSSLRSPQCR